MHAREIAKLVGPEDSTILDIGANDGGSGAAIAEFLPKAKVYAFECDPRAIKRFKNNVKNPRVTLIEKAIGQGPERKIKFFQSNNVKDDNIDSKMPEGWDYSGSIRKPTGHLEMFPWVTFSNEVEIELISLDEWASKAGISKIDFIWADVQGAEGDMIEGGRNLLANTRYLYTECFDTELYAGAPNLEAIMKLLPDFEIVERFPEDVLLRNRRLTSSAPER